MGSDLRKVTSFSDRIEAELLANYLKSCGIEVFLKSDDAGGINTAMTASNGVHLFVSEAQFEEASAILNAEHDLDVDAEKPTTIL